MDDAFNADHAAKLRRLDQPDRGLPSVALGVTLTLTGVVIDEPVDRDFHLEVPQRPSSVDASSDAPIITLVTVECSGLGDDEWGPIKSLITPGMCVRVETADRPEVLYKRDDSTAEYSLARSIRVLANDITPLGHTTELDIVRE